MSEPQGSARARTYTWADPDLLVAATKGMSGLDSLRAFVDGRLPAPPFSDTLGIRIVSAELGNVTFEMTPEPWHYNPLGTVHGGIIATLADSSLGCAVQTHLPAGVGYTTLEVKLNFVRPVLVKTGLIRCRGEVISVGRRVATAQAHITDSAGKLYGHATTTCLIFPMEEGA